MNTVNGIHGEGRPKEDLDVGLSRARDVLVVCRYLEMIRRVGGEAVAERLMQAGGRAPAHAG